MKCRAQTRTGGTCNIEVARGRCHLHKGQPIVHHTKGHSTRRVDNDVDRLARTMKYMYVDKSPIPMIQSGIAKQKRNERKSYHPNDLSQDPWLASLDRILEDNNRAIDAHAPSAPPMLPTPDPPLHKTGQAKKQTRRPGRPRR
eukprot:jgi/Mesvir1/8073/Mv10524-RA.1